MTLGAVDLRTALGDARRRLEALEHQDIALSACAAGLARMEAVLARPPRVVILGEVNSGKTSVADLLLGVGLLPSSVVANTQFPILIHYAETTALYAVSDTARRLVTADDLDALGDNGLRALEIGLNSERLKEFEILDTPALSPDRESIVDGDIRIWCTVATRAWTESERGFWSSLPRRNWRNALLVATHRDALEDPLDAAKIEWRLRAAAGDMFRDVVLVSATDAGKSRRTNGRTSDASAITLLGQIRVWAAEIRERRARKVEKIVARLARLTFHHLARAPLRPAEAKMLKEWETDSARLLGALGKAPDDFAAVMPKILRRFARALEEIRPGSITGHPLAASGRAAGGAPARKAGAGARRFARLITADLTTLLRIELARAGGLRDANLLPDYEAARAVLLPLAQLDAEFAKLEDMLLPRRETFDSYEIDPEELLATVRGVR